MNALTLRKLSPLAKRERASHARALTSPMTRIPMAGDPNLSAIDNLREGRAMLERRACQYAAWIAERDGLFPIDPRKFNASYDGAGTVRFAAYGRARDFAVAIPAHVLAFDPTAPALPAPGAEPAPAPRCDHTASLTLDAPAEIAPAPSQREPPAAAPQLPAPAEPRAPTAPSAPRKRPTKAMREFAESRAMRAARIAQLPAAQRRYLGCRV